MSSKHVCNKKVLECDVSNYFWRELQRLINQKCTHASNFKFTQLLTLFGEDNNVKTDLIIIIIIMSIFTCPFSTSIKLTARYNSIITYIILIPSQKKNRKTITQNITRNVSLPFTCAHTTGGRYIHSMQVTLNLMEYQCPYSYASRKRCVFKAVLNAAMSRSSLISGGMEFQTTGAAAEKALSPRVFWLLADGSERADVSTEERVL